jgi:hypothetical protein
MNTKPLCKEHVGKRLLVSNYSVSLMTDPVEAKLLEMSPSGMYAHIQVNRHDGTMYSKWCHANDYVVLEQLQEEATFNEQWLRELHEKEQRDTEDFKKYSSPTSKPSYWDSLPTSVCGSDHHNISAQDPTSFSQHAEVAKQKWVHGICNPPMHDAKQYVKHCKSTGNTYNSVSEMMKHFMKKNKENK